MALCLPGRASPVTVAAARPSRLAQRRSTMASPAALVAGRRRLGAAVCAAWSHAASRAYPLRVVASSVDHPRRAVRTRAVADVADATAEVRTGGYPFEDIEARWQKHWADNKTFRTPEQIDTSKPKFYALDMFPYPSGAGLHVGHPEGYTATDIIARYKRMTGHNVLHPMGWDAFGLPAEQYAIETGTHPRDTTTVNVSRFREQLQALGFSYDWDREVATCDPTYFKWTQWIFLQLLERGLAYQAEVPVNWCPALGTVLANEEVVDGVSERGGHPVIRKPMKQWMLKITAYGDRLLNDLDDLDWPESIKEMQRNWIGRSEGAQLAFDVPGVDGSLEVYTTRPDTLFGATYLVVAPEHPLVDALTSDEQKEAVEEYVLAASRKSDLERTELAKEKTGVFTGTHATHPLTGEDVPVWVADYVLGTYGTGAIMAVPAHDDRDFEFATQFGLPVVQVVQPPEGAEEGACHAGAGKMVNSACDALDVNEMDNVEAGAKVTEWLEAKGIGAKKVNFKLRDWLFARQRYWGEPFPVVYAEGSDEPIPVPLEQLPLTLPETDNFKPSGSGEGPLANVEDWVQTTDPVGGGAARRETNTMPQWAGSCWYYLRFIDPKNENAMVDGSLEKYWMPVDLYVGGAEHAVLHLLYARFWHKVLYDIGAVSTKEPFRRLVSQGMILGEMEYAAFVDADGNYVSAKGKTDGLESVKVAPEDVKKKGDGYVLAADESVKLTGRAHKMSKSRGNVVNPDDVVAQYGADSLRLYEMFMGPLKETKMWQTKGVEGCSRFLARAYRLFEKVSAEPATEEQLKAINACVAKVTEETEGMRFNTAIAAMMEFTNAATKWDSKPAEALEPFALLLSPYAPHLSEELWSKLGREGSNAYETWPTADESLLVEDTITLAVQVNGKMRGKVELAADASQDDAMDAAMAQENIAKFVTDPDAIKKIIYVPGKILNVVAPPPKK